MKRIPSGDLTVIFRNDGPMVCAEDTPSYRTVRIKLTPEQRKELAVNKTYAVGNKQYFERISMCILEPEFNDY